MVAGEQVRFTVQARDSFGNRRLKGYDDLKVWSSANEIQFDWQDHDTGNYDISYTATQAGHLSLNVELDDLPLSGSPFDVKVRICRRDTCTDM